MELKNINLTKRNSIDFCLSKEDTAILKGIAICGMLCWHLFHCPNPIGVEFSAFTKWIGLMGDVCVSVFLFVSGLGLSISYKNVETEDTQFSAMRYVFRRLIKFYSGYWVIFALFIPIGVFFFNQQVCDSPLTMSSVKIWIKEFLAIGGFSSYNVSWWFNALIISLYILFPLLYYGVKHACIPTILIAYFLRHTDFICIGMNMGLYMFIFVLGIVAALYSSNITSFLRKLPSIVIYVSTGIFILIPSLVLPMMDDEYVFYSGLKLYALLTIGFVLVVVLLLKKTKYIKFVLTNLGKHSANIYLMHTFIFYYWFPDYFYSLRSPIVIFGCLMVFCLLLSGMIEYGKEKLGYNKIVSYILGKI